MFAVATALLILPACASSGGTDDSPDQRPRVERLLVEEVTIWIKPEAISVAESSQRDIVAEVEAAATRVIAALDSPETEVFVESDGTRAIPDIGVGGRTSPRTGSVLIWIDPEFDDPDRLFGLSLPRALAHELHHSKRILDGPGYGRTVEEVVVTEGLAALWEEEFFPGPPTPWGRALTNGELSRAGKQLLIDGDRRSTRARHAIWFFGEGDLPYWTGYALGYEIAYRFTQENEVSAAEAATIKPKVILQIARK